MGSKEIALPHFSDKLFIDLAREIAMEVQPVHKILEDYKVSPYDWELIQRNPTFLRFLQGQIQEWNSAINTSERIKFKSASLLETWLMELGVRLHDESESLSSKIEGGKLIARLAGLGIDKASMTDNTEKFSITINLGGDNQLKVEKNVTPRVIDAE